MTNFFNKKAVACLGAGALLLTALGAPATATSSDDWVSSSATTTVVDGVRSAIITMVLMDTDGNPLVDAEYEYQYVLNAPDDVNRGGGGTGTELNPDGAIPPFTVELGDDASALSWEVTATLPDGSTMTGSGHHLFDSIDEGGSGGTDPCNSFPITVNLTKTDPDGNPLPGAAFSVTSPQYGSTDWDEPWGQGWLRTNPVGGGAFLSTFYDPAAFSDGSWPIDWVEQSLDSMPPTDADGKTSAVLADSRENSNQCSTWTTGLSSSPSKIGVMSEVAVPDGFLALDDFTLTATGTATEVVGEKNHHLSVPDLRIATDSPDVEITGQGWVGTSYFIEMTVVNKPIPVEPEPTPPAPEVPVVPAPKPPAPTPAPEVTPEPTKPTPPRVAE